LAEKISKTFCILPWMHLFLANNGRPHHCCLSVGYGDSFIDQKGEAYSADNYERLEQSWNSEEVKKVRRQLLSGEEPAACVHCFSVEKRGAISLRHAKNQRYKIHIEDAIRNTSADGSAPLHLRSADFRLGNTCNLKCRMCNSSASSGLKREEIALGTHIEKNSTGNFAWHENRELWRQFLDCNPDLDSIEFAGGEPLLSRNFHWVVDELIASGRAKNIVLFMHTNLTQFDDELFKKMEHFRGVDFQVSLEGFGRVNEYIRQPSDWPSQEKRLRALNAWAVYPFRKVSINTVVQAHNALHLAEFFAFQLDELRNFNNPTMTVLENPSPLSVLSLPHEMRAEAARRLRDLLNASDEERLPARWAASARKNFRDYIGSVIQVLESEDRLPPAELIHRTKAQDNFRGQFIGDYIPELAPLFI
jgi:sulfatase maturation enzyme AslB (radical SAM superfamily)